MTARSSGSAIRLLEIRAHEGSQARAWEELAYQLRPAVGEGHVETRKTRAPDAGVEWYEVYSDGRQEGFQAKFHSSLADALGGMRESVKAVSTKRPELTKLTFVVPYDFTDSGTAETTTDQDRWTKAVAKWRTDFPNVSKIEFATIRAGDITGKLSLKEHAGRREYWFGGLEITDEWLKYRFDESVQSAGERYTPEADSPSAINEILDAVALGPSFIANFRSLARRAISAARQDIGMWGTSTAAAVTLIEQLQGACDPHLQVANSEGDILPPLPPEFGEIASFTRSLIELAYVESERLRSYERRNLDAAISTLQALQSLAGGDTAKVVAARALALVGPAGQGKTHALMRAVEGSLERGAPALAILGQRLSDKNWWPALAETLGGLAVSSDEFLQGLDSLAEARECRALIVIDAINEAQSPTRWRYELPAMVAQFQRYPHVALIISYRTDYRDVVGAPKSLIKVRHPGLAGGEAEALAAYCNLYSIPLPSKGLFEPALSSPLFLRMYCEVLAADPDNVLDAPTRSNLFARYADVVGARVVSKLNLAPTTTTVSDALTRIAERILDNQGRPVPRAQVEAEVDSFLPGRTWPLTLFQQLASEGLIELRPTYDGTEAVGFPFQAYSEHLLADRLLASVDEASRGWACRFLPLPRRVKRLRLLAKRLGNAPWSWRSVAVVLPQRESVELIDLLPGKAQDFRLQEAMRESLTDRSAADFGPRALEFLTQCLTEDLDDYGHGIETIISLAPREGHPGNADWLHAQLLPLPMPDRDSTWSIATFQVDQYSDAYRRLTRWAERLTNSVGHDEVRLAAILLMWLFTSPNRFLRDGASKSLVKFLSQHLVIASSLVQAARETDDPYIQERVLTCCYGAVLVGGDHDLDSVRTLLESLSTWRKAGLPVDVIARDSVRGVAAWCVDRGLLPSNDLPGFEPPYESDPPAEPPTREELENAYGPVTDADGNYTAWRASSILHSCLDWMGDFNKYVVKGDVGFFSWHPLSGDPPTEKNHTSPLDEVEADWAGRWIAHRAIALGWTTDRFETFERDHNLRRGREAHKAERFGKKYQWIALRELLARLADNFHPSYETWSTHQNTYEGPWVWYGRDFDPTLPPSSLVGESQVCRVAQDDTATWATLPSPDLDVIATPDEWVGKSDDLPTADQVFSCTDPDGRRWMAIQRYSTWDRDNAQRAGIAKRERDIFFLQFSWLVPKGKGPALYGFIETTGLSGRWMPDINRTHHQYLGESNSAPVVRTMARVLEDFHIPSKLRGAGIQPMPAVEKYLWEGSTLDCSIDESVDVYAPAPELLGEARWVGHSSSWSAEGKVVVRAIDVPDGEGQQSALLVDADWLNKRLRDLDLDLVIGTLSERHALPVDDDDFRRMAFSDVWYVALLSHDDAPREAGPMLKVRRQVGKTAEQSASASELPDEPFDPSQI